eukprot:2100750-Pyramimonas_sp.AAC.1
MCGKSRAGEPEGGDCEPFHRGLPPPACLRDHHASGVRGGDRAVPLLRGGHRAQHLSGGRGRRLRVSMTRRHSRSLGRSLLGL